ncbi:hypothetical protein TeGR_g5988 [Tetraparma gracilis]|uniref:Uncharacterized protein n=1 Tax=Tetraparma gracilis TaxID=2962635 RepID=A0ABQ6N4A3_9STRA|nr:hypothetical protein TeGR_g5988 [Tetraparma gracilis]
MHPPSTRPLPHAGRHNKGHSRKDREQRHNHHRDGNLSSLSCSKPGLASNLSFRMGSVSLPASAGVSPSTSPSSSPLTASPLTASSPRSDPSYLGLCGSPRPRSLPSSPGMHPLSHPAPSSPPLPPVGPPRHTRDSSNVSAMSAVSGNYVSESSASGSPPWSLTEDSGYFIGLDAPSLPPPSPLKGHSSVDDCSSVASTSSYTSASSYASASSSTPAHFLGPSFYATSSLPPSSPALSLASSVGSYGSAPSAVPSLTSLSLLPPSTSTSSSTFGWDEFTSATGVCLAKDDAAGAPSSPSRKVPVVSFEVGGGKEGDAWVDGISRMNIGRL